MAAEGSHPMIVSKKAAKNNRSLGYRLFLSIVMLAQLTLVVFAFRLFCNSKTMPFSIDKNDHEQANVLLNVLAERCRSTGDLLEYYVRPWRRVGRPPREVHDLHAMAPRQ